MLREMLLALAVGLTLAPGVGAAAEAAKPATADTKSGEATRPAAPLAHLKPYEERRYRIDMQDCDKQKGVDRKLCERTVRNKAVAKSRRRGAAH